MGMALAQIHVTGTVTSAEDGQPVIGASVKVVGTNTGAATNLDGQFSMTVPNNAKLEISYIGMKSQIVKAAANLKVVLQADDHVLDEVIVTGYGNFKKSSFTGAAASMSTEKLSDVPSMSVEDKLSGNIPGVSISTSSGQPGAMNFIRIRGMGSINAGNDPLIVIDGTPMQSGNISSFHDPTTGDGYNSAGTNVLSTLNSNDIESITVIKDAAAASLYGSRAANGVIVITTKSGGVGKTKVDFRGDWGFSNMAVNYRPTLNGDDRRALIYQGLKNYVFDGNAGDATDEAAATAFADSHIDDYAAKPKHGWANWKDAIFKNGSNQNYQASISGGNEKTKFYSSVSYGKQEGVIEGSELERMTGNANLNHTFGRFKLDVTTLFSSMNQKAVADGGASFSGALPNAIWFLGPSNAIYDKDGNMVEHTDGAYNGGINPIFENKHQFDITKTKRSYSTIALEWNIWDNLKLREKVAYDYINSVEDVLWDKYSNDGNKSQGVLQRVNNEFITMNTQTQLSYVKSFGLHNIDALLGFETESWHQNNQYIHGDSYPGDLYEFVNAGSTSAESYKYDSKMTSVLGRLNYNYDNKYYAGGSFRRDGSSRMARENRWGSFWSLSGAWRFGGEKFMESLKSVVTDGKLRVSYGVNGTQPSGLYNYMNLYKYGEYYNGFNGMGIIGIANKDLKWEQNKAWNFGLDLTLIDRISVTLDYYVRNTSNLIMNRPVSFVPGYYDSSSYGATVAQNIGSMRNSGIELTIQSTNIQTPDFTWTTSLNLGHNSNKVTALTGDEDQIITGTMIHKVGKPYYSYYMYEYAGVDSKTGLESFYINDGSENARQTTTDVSKAKKVIVGKHDPAIEGGLSNYIKWKFIDFNFTMAYKLGGDSYDFATWLHDNGGTYALYGAIPSYYKLADMWKQEGDNAKLPKFQTEYGKRVTSSRWLMPNDYLRLKNLTVGFSAPQQWIRRYGLNKARLYFSANNLLTWKSDDMFVDPETPTDGLCTFEMPALRTFTFGVELSF
uniref:TonB-dependent receptor n=1 Tax=Prevotella sp. GTC17262 TaxID=3236797 RepID=A0AB33JU43_9BACT